MEGSRVRFDGLKRMDMSEEFRSEPIGGAFSQESVMPDLGSATGTAPLLQGRRCPGDTRNRAVTPVCQW